MNWRIGISRIMLVLWGVISIMFAVTAINDESLRPDLIYIIGGSFAVFMGIGWAVSWVIEGFSSESPKDPY